MKHPTRHMEEYPHCLLWGGYGFGNTGDELTLAVALHDARKDFGDSVGILTRDPEYTRQLFPDVSLIRYSPGSPPAWLRHIRRAYFKVRGQHWSPWLRDSDQWKQIPWDSKRTWDAKWVQYVSNCRRFYLVGGGYLTDLLEWDDVFFPIRVASFYSIPVVTAPLGLGTFVTSTARHFLNEAFKQATVTVRDQFSFEFCENNLISATLKPDDGFRAKEVIPGLHKHSRDEMRRYKVGVCVFHQPNTEELARTQTWWVDLLRRLKELDQELDVQAFCFHTNRELDFGTAVKLFEAAGLDESQVTPPQIDFRMAIRNLCNFDLILTTRFHAAVIACVVGIPFFAVATTEYYKAKMAAAVGAAPDESGLINPLRDSPEQVVDQVVAACRGHKPGQYTVAELRAASA